MDGKQHNKFSPNAAQITTEAASWVAQLDSGELSNADRLALAEWLSRSPSHAAELRRLAKVWGSIDDVLNQITTQATTPNSYSLAGVLRRWFSSRSLGTKTMVVGGIGAGLSAAVACCVWLLIWFQFSPSHDVYRTSFGAPKRYSLADGSTVTLNTNTLLEFSITRNTRDIQLHQGEALFEVAKDPHKPFRVKANKTLVEAVGTAFVIQVKGESVDVTVTEGRVAVHPPSGPASSAPQAIAPTLVSAGQALLTSASQASLHNVVDLNDAGLSKRTAWERGLLIFDTDTLADVVAEMGRYLPQTIIITDPELSAQTFSGVFQAGDMETLLMTLETSFNIERKTVSAEVLQLQRSTQ